MAHQHGKDLMIKFTINIQDILERKMIGIQTNCRNMSGMNFQRMEKKKMTSVKKKNSYIIIFSQGLFL
jgi:hypothetical protein